VTAERDHVDHRGVVVVEFGVPEIAADGELAVGVSP
jgi:hypothetical protein